VTEIFISVGVISLEIALYIALVKYFPILGGASRPKPVTKPVVSTSPKPAPSPA
jgi:Ni/Fe-hydrogenase subunit HybB-like protein